MSFVPFNDLERSLIKAATDPAHRAQFLVDFLESQVFVIEHGVPPPDNPVHKTLEAGYQLTVQNILIDGKEYVPVFSSVERLRVGLTHEVAYVAVPVRDFLELSRGSNLMLNPGSDYGKEFLAEEIEALLQNKAGEPAEHWVAPEETEVLIGAPANFPTELTSALSRLYARHRSVKRAWVAHFFNPKRDQSPHTLLALETEGDYQEILKATGVVVQSVKIPDPPVDIMRLTGGGGIENYFLKNTPFYKRKLLRRF